MNYHYVCQNCGREMRGAANLRVCAKWKGGCGGKLKRVYKTAIPVKMICGHSVQDIRGDKNEGTYYCAKCEEEAR